MMVKILLLIFSQTSTGSACHIPLYVTAVPTVHDSTKRDLNRRVAGEPKWTVSLRNAASLYAHMHTGT
jgi:hypothetical protein